MVSRISREKAGLDRSYPDLIIAIALCISETLQWGRVVHSCMPGL